MPEPELTVDQVMAEVRGLFREADLDDPALEARILVSGLLDLEPAAMISRGRSPVSADDVARIRVAAERRLAGAPVYRILGWREFYGLRLRLSSGTLEPRPDTEVLVDSILPLLRGMVGQGRKPRLLDLGTGTGAICLALLHECPEASGVGTDIPKMPLEQRRPMPSLTVSARGSRSGRATGFRRCEGGSTSSSPTPLYSVCRHRRPRSRSAGA